MHALTRSLEFPRRPGLTRHKGPQGERGDVVAGVPVRRPSLREVRPPWDTAPQITAADQADYLKAAVCMRNHGISGFPDPVFSNGNVNFPIPQGMNTSSTPFRRAREVCEVLIPAGLPYSKEAQAGQ